MKYTLKDPPPQEKLIVLELSVLEAEKVMAFLSSAMLYYIHEGWRKRWHGYSTTYAFRDTLRAAIRKALPSE